MQIACQNEDGRLDEILSQVQKNDAMAHDVVDLSVRIRVSSGTRGSDEDHFRNEHIISHLELFFFDAETRKFVTKAVVDDLIQEKDSPDASYDITYIVESVRIKVGVLSRLLLLPYQSVF